MPQYVSSTLSSGLGFGKAIYIWSTTPQLLKSAA
jgi:hypothetical protein